MIIRGAKHSLAATTKKVEKPAAAPKKERKVRKVIPQVVEPEIVETPVVEETIEVKDEE